MELVQSEIEVKRALPSDREPDEIKRESIWSVKEEDRHKFSIYFIILFLIGVAFACWYEIFYIVGDSVFATIMALVRDIGLVGIASVVLTFARFEGEDSMGIALDLYRKQQYEKGKQAGLDIGSAERDALRKRIAELESRNGASPEDSHPSEEDGSPK